MRNIKFIIGLIALVAASWGLLRWSAESPNVRGQDPNVETRGLNTAGLPIVPTSGTAEPTAGSTSGHDGRAGSALGDNGWSGDGGFVVEAAEFHARGAALAELAERSGSEDVRGLATELRRLHTTAESTLRALAEGKNWAFPQSLDALQQTTLDEMQQSARNDFDGAYVDEVVRSLERAVSRLRVAESSASDEDLKGWAVTQRGALESALARARDVER